MASVMEMGRLDPQSRAKRDQTVLEDRSCDEVKSNQS